MGRIQTHKADPIIRTLFSTLKPSGRTGVALATSVVQSFLLVVLLVLSGPHPAEDANPSLAVSSAPLPQHMAFLGKRDAVRIILSADQRVFGKARASDPPDAIVPNSPALFLPLRTQAAALDLPRRSLVSAAFTAFQPRAPPSALA